MKVLVITHGSRGDVQPFVALGRGLIEAGHEVLLAAPDGWADLAARHGVPFVGVFDVMARLNNASVFRAQVETDARGLRGAALRSRVRRFVRPLLGRLLDDLAALSPVDADLVVFYPVIPGQEVAERWGVPAVAACLQPIWVPTASFRNPMFPVRVPAAFNRVTYVWTQVWLRRLTGPTAQWRRESLGLPRRRWRRDPLRRPDGSRSDVLHAFSPHAFAEPPRYPGRAHPTGFWFLPEEEDWVPSHELVRFIEAGDPPVYIGFGSIVGISPEQADRLVADAVRMAGVRAVVLPASSRAGRPSTDHIFYHGTVPYSWLFPRMSVIVHHGGMGTVGLAMASGRPQVICPFQFEQRFFAERMHELGAACPPLPIHALSSERLATAIKAAVTDPAMAAHAADLAGRVRAEDGVAAAVRVLESWNRRIQRCGGSS